MSSKLALILPLLLLSGCAAHKPVSQSLPPCRIPIVTDRVYSGIGKVHTEYVPNPRLKPGERCTGSKHQHELGGKK